MSSAFNSAFQHSAWQTIVHPLQRIQKKHMHGIKLAYNHMFSHYTATIQLVSNIVLYLQNSLARTFKNTRHWLHSVAFEVRILQTSQNPSHCIHLCFTISIIVIQWSFCKPNVKQMAGTKMRTILKIHPQIQLIPTQRYQMY